MSELVGVPTQKIVSDRVNLRTVSDRVNLRTTYIESRHVETIQSLVHVAFSKQYIEYLVSLLLVQFGNYAPNSAY